LNENHKLSAKQKAAADAELVTLQLKKQMNPGLKCLGFFIPRRGDWSYFSTESDHFAEGPCVRGSIVIAALCYFENLVRCCAGDAIDQPMFVSDPPRPPSSKLAPERFRLTKPLKRTTLSIFDEGVDLSKDFCVGALPMQIVVPSLLSPLQVQSTCLPALAARILLSNRRALAGERRR